jgi:hypothetical protein
MIRRVSDFSNLSNDSFEKIAEVIKNKENKKLYKICNNENEVTIAMKEIKLNGYNVEIEKLGEKYNVYSILPECLNLQEAEKSGNFKKLAWGRYSFQKVNSIGDFGTYSFDDGSIWKTITGEDGKEYLVKEVEDEDSNEIIRQASMKKKANNVLVDDNNYHTIMQILYHNSSTPTSQFMEDLFASDVVKAALFNMLSQKVNSIITEKIQQQNLSNPENLNIVLTNIQEHINSGHITDENMLESVLYNCIQEIMYQQSYSIEHNE